MDIRPLPIQAVPTDVTASRAVNNIYQNTTGRPLLVLIRGTLVINNVIGAVALGLFSIGLTSPPLNLVGHIGLFTNAAAPNGLGIYGMVVCIVPVNNYYQFLDNSNANGTLTLTGWWEMQL